MLLGIYNMRLRSHDTVQLTTYCCDLCVPVYGCTIEPINSKKIKLNNVIYVSFVYIEL